MSSPQGADSPTMSDAFMAFRLMMNYIEDLSITVDSKARIRTFLDEINSSAILSNVLTVNTVTTVITVSNVTNLAEIGGNPANSFIFDTMDIVWNTGIRPQIV
jgi:hypothetical protein